MSNMGQWGDGIIEEAGGLRAAGGAGNIALPYADAIKAFAAAEDSFGFTGKYAPEPDDAIRTLRGPDTEDGPFDMADYPGQGVYFYHGATIKAVRVRGSEFLTKVAVR